MSWLASLAREAARAGTCLRRLEAAVADLQRVASEPRDWELTRAERRVAGLVGEREPFAPLAMALARIGARGTLEDREAPVVRRIGGEVAAREVRRRVREFGPAAGGPNNSASESATGAAAPGTASRHLQQAGSAQAWNVSARGDRGPRSTSTETDAEGHLEGRASAGSASRAAIGPTTRAGSGHAVIDAGQSEPAPARAAADAVPEASSSAAGIGTAEKLGYADPAQAAYILSKRMQAAAVLGAFRSALRLDDAPAFRALAPIRTTAVEADTQLIRDAAPLGGPWDQPHNDSLKVGAPAATESQARIRRRPPETLGEPRLTGLRRLASLATEALDDIGQPVPPVQPTLPSANLEEQFERLLRAEAIAHGIDPEGAVR